LWNPIMERFADMIGGTSAWLSQLSVEDGGGGELDDPMTRVDPAFPPRYLAWFTQRNPFNAVDDPRAHLKGWTPRILTDEDWIAKEELVASEYYSDFLRPQDIHSVLMIRLATRGAETAVLNVNRPERRGQFSRAERDLAARHHPHFIRAFEMGQKFQATRRLNSEIADVLDHSSHGVFLVDETGRLRHVNRVGEGLLAETEGLRLIGGRLRATSPSATSRLLGLISQAGSRDPEQRTGGSMSLPTPLRRLPLSLTIAPMRSEGPTPLERSGSVMVCVTDLEAGVRLPEQRLRDLFALTPAEARLALALFEGLSPREAAMRFDVSPNTVHVQLARIFEKTGSSRQTDLMRLMMRAVGVALS